VNAADWPQWQGPTRANVWAEDGIIEQIPAAGLEQTWRVALGPGYAGPAVAADKVFVFDRVPQANEAKLPEGAIPKNALAGQERLLCLDAGTGKELWQHAYLCPYQISYPTGPRVTPMVVGQRVYILGAMGDLLCLDVANGKPLWHKQLMKEYQLEQPPVWGYAAAPLLVGDRLLTLVGGEGSAVVALNAATGKEIWRALSSEEVGYAPPILHTVAGQPQAIIWLSDRVAGLDPQTGKLLWEFPYPHEGLTHRPTATISAPVAVGERLLVCDFWHGITLYQLGAKPTRKWTLASKNPFAKVTQGMHTVMSPLHLRGEHVYGTCGQGELRCLKADTGEQLWVSRELYGGKPALFGTTFIVAQGDRDWLWTDQGDLWLVKLSPQGLTVLGRTHLLAPSQTARGREVVWSAPAFADRAVFVRNDKEIIRVNLAKK
jgi:outer membrane protein assembly factor BamB